MGWVLKLWNNNIEREGNHLQLPIPFRESKQELPISWPMAYKRQMSLKGCLEHNKDLLGKYTEEMRSLLKESLGIYPTNQCLTLTNYRRRGFF